MNNLEKPKEEEEKKTSGHSVGEFFNIRNLKEGFITVLKKREYSKRTLIILVILAFELEIFALRGQWGNTYLFLRRRLEFDVVQFSRMITIFGVFGLFAQYIAVPFFSRRLKWKDSSISLAGKFPFPTIVYL